MIMEILHSAWQVNYCYFEVKNNYYESKTYYMRISQLTVKYRKSISMLGTCMIYPRNNMCRCNG